jgi:Alpha/beta hydrolase family
MSISPLATAALIATIALTGESASAASTGFAATHEPPVVSLHTISVQGINVFYREAGDAHAPAILLLHGFPASSFMYRNLIPLLADRYHVIAPDLPGFGFTEGAAERPIPLHLRQSGRDG